MKSTAPAPELCEMCWQQGQDVPSTRLVALIGPFGPVEIPICEACYQDAHDNDIPIEDVES